MPRLNNLLVIKYMSHVQSVLIKKKYYNSLTKAKQKIRAMGFIVKKVDITKNLYRFRQRAPNSKLYYYRIKKVSRGVELVLGFRRDNR